MARFYRNKKPRKITGILIVAIVVLLLVLGGIFSKQLETFSADLFSNLHYSSSDEISEIADKIGLTNYGRFIFGATNPVIEGRENFNAHCNSYDESTSTLGCFGGGKIYIYDVVADELAGIKESTAAHELMHAVWRRLSEPEKSELSAAILETYNNSKNHDALAKELEKYSENEIVDELHSRFATEVKDLPEKLEEHYAKYFTDQDAVVVFYENYREPFEKLDADFQKLNDSLKTLKAEFDEKQASYLSRSEVLSAAVAEFNANANNFSSRAEFNARRAELLAESDALNDLYDELTELVETYNAKVDEYNNNVLRSEKLDSMMNSNSKVELN